MFENLIANVTAEQWRAHVAWREKFQHNRELMLAVWRDIAKLRFPNLNLSDPDAEAYNVGVLQDVWSFVEPCEKCDRKVCNRRTCKLTTIVELELHGGYLSPRYEPNCRRLKRIVSFANLVNFIRYAPPEI